MKCILESTTTTMGRTENLYCLCNVIDSMLDILSIYDVCGLSYFSHITTSNVMFEILKK